MVSVARKNLFHERGRVAISVAGVAFAVMLILILAGVYAGFQESVTAYVERSGADLFVAQEGTTDMFHSFSILPLNLSERIAAVPGITSVSPLISRQVEVHLDGGHAKASVIGFRDMGGPWQIAEGTGSVGEGQIVIDKVFATNNDLRVGSSLRIGEKPFEVVGISEGTNMFLLQFAFVPFDDAYGLVLPEGTTTFLLATVSPGERPGDVADRIEAAVPGIIAYTTPQFAESNAKLVAESFDPLLLVLYAIGGLTGVLVIGLTVYTATIERTKEYGILKALGATNGRLFRVLLSQASVLAALGFVVGLAITAATVQIVSRLVPSMYFYFPPEVFPYLLGATLAMGALATYVPMGKIARIDPAAVFRRG